MLIDRADEFASRAQRAALGVVAGAVVAAGRQAVAEVAAQTEVGYLAESAHDVAAVRADRRLSSALESTRSLAVRVVRDQALAALEDGFRTTADAEAGPLGLRLTFGPEDALALAGHPIVDATAAEWAKFLADRLDWRLRSIVTRAALGSLKPAAIPDQVHQASVAWSLEVARLAGDAWRSGRTAARSAMARALAS